MASLANEEAIDKSSFKSISMCSPPIEELLRFKGTTIIKSPDRLIKCDLL
jgi:hypothetical protein